MKLGIDCHHIEDQRGIKRYTLALLKEWDNLGYIRDRENKIICYFKKELPEFDELPKEVQIVITGSRSTFWFQHIRLTLEASRDKLDVLFSPSYILPFFYSRRKKSVVTIHDIVYTVLPNEFDWHSNFDKSYLPKAAYLSAKKATFILTPSEFMKREIGRVWNINPAKIFVTPLAGDINFAKTQPILPRQDFILFIGSIFNRRHIAELIHAFYKIVRKEKTLRLIIIGKDLSNPPQHIDDLIEEANYKIAREAIVRKDWVGEEELLRLYYSARALVLLSDYEGFGLPVLEALSCGLPVVITKRGSLPEVAGEAALYVSNPRDIDEITRRLLKILTDGNLRRSLKSKGLKQAQQFSWSKTAKDTWDILNLAAKS
ncbi:MAG: glycosyltransferase family 4 protein [Candidatus Portnoybacteria bacterium]|nr:glycosyltransferase family 4 protein [Candidatus Portnoybacteria bacterium]